RIPFILEPARHTRVDDRLTHFRNDDVRWHVLLLPRRGPPARCSNGELERTGDELPLVLAVTGGRPLGGARTARPREDRQPAVPHQTLELRSHEVPRAHVLGLFLNPEDFLEIRKPLDRREDVVNGQWIELLDPRDGDGRRLFV